MEPVPVNKTNFPKELSDFKLPSCDLSFQNICKSTHNVCDIIIHFTELQRFYKQLDIYSTSIDQFIKTPSKHFYITLLFNST